MLQAMQAIAAAFHFVAMVLTFAAVASLGVVAGCAIVVAGVLMGVLA